ncbi:hypothetical protein [Streptomyces marincola]|uniref:hypothetical protein n=1 Tax=Streptomyces marincola TaxID=2878388 RepID=UPI0038511B1C
MPERVAGGAGENAAEAGERGAGTGAGRGRRGLSSGPGRLLVTLYGIFTVGATSRSVYQLSTRFDEAPLAYLLSALAALVYAFITVSLVRGGERARRGALAACVAELAGVLTVGAWSVADPAAFPDATVWSDFGQGYLYLPVVLPVAGLLWLRRAPRAEGPDAPS